MRISQGDTRIWVNPHLIEAVYENDNGKTNIFFSNTECPVRCDQEFEAVVMYLESINNPPVKLEEKPNE